MSYPHPSDKHDDGSATWNVLGAEVIGYPADDDHDPAVQLHLDELTLSPQSAVDLAQALQAAAMHALRETLGLRDRS